MMINVGLLNDVPLLGHKGLIHNVMTNLGGFNVPPRYTKSLHALQRLLYCYHESQAMWYVGSCRMLRFQSRSSCSGPSNPNQVLSSVRV